MSKSSESTSLAEPSCVLIPGDGEMAVLVREFDWRKSPLGPVSGWSRELIAAANLVLHWPSPMTLYWGQELCLIYNDGYKEFLEGKHPHSLGAPAAQVWAELWPAVEPEFAKVLTSRTPVVKRDTLLPAAIDGSLRDEWWTYTLSRSSRATRWRAS